MRLFFPAAILAALSSTVFAADLPARTQPAALAPTLTTNWAGLSVGGQLGFASSRSTLFVNESDWDFFPDFDGGGHTMGHRANSAFAGAEVAYNFQQGNFVYGGFASISGLNAHDKTWSPNRGDGSGDDQFTTRLKGIGIVGGRVGYAVDRVLLHVSAGYALGHVSFDITDVNVLQDGSPTDNSTGHKKTSKWLSGFALGAGIDYQLTKNWSAVCNITT